MICRKIKLPENVDLPKKSILRKIGFSGKVDYTKNSDLRRINENFDSKCFVLEIKKVHGSHTSEMIMSKLQNAFNHWKLDPLLLTMMVQDSNSNIKKVYREWGVSNFACIGHNFHLITGPLHVKPKNKKTLTESQTDTINDIDQNDELENEEDDVTDLYGDCFDK